MTEFIEQLVTLALTVIIFGFSLQSYRMIYKKLCKLDTRPHTAAAEPAVRRRQPHPPAEKEAPYE